ncbi:MAG: hypothetical protein QM528_01860 [Phycisphaerales bacterium]|nr:hypothetical protein [Phycisphaerales bacterium]
MKIFIGVFIAGICMFGVIAFCQKNNKTVVNNNRVSVITLLKQAEQYEHDIHDKKAYDIYFRLYSMQPNNQIFASKAIMMGCLLGRLANNKIERLELFKKAFIIAERIEKQDSLINVAYIAIALAYYSISEFESKDKVYIYRMRHALDLLRQSLSVRVLNNRSNDFMYYDPSYTDAHFLIGKIYLSLNKTSWIKNIKLHLHRGLPKPTLDSTIYFLEKADKIYPNNITINFYLQVAYHLNNQVNEEIKTLELISYKLPFLNEEEKILKDKAKESLKKLE